MKSISDIIKLRSFKKDFHNKYEYQAYGNRLAEEFNDMKHRALYIKLAKNEDRNLLEVARDFVIHNTKATTKGRLFMWKFTKLKREQKTTNTG